MSEAVELAVHIAFDREARRWYTAEGEVPGLVLEAEAPGELIRRISEAAPELVEFNLPHLTGREIAIRPVFDDPLALAAA